MQELRGSSSPYLSYCCCFVEGTGGNVLGDVSHMTIPELEEWGVGLNTGITWEDALHSALMPITPQASMGSLADGESTWMYVRMYDSRGGVVNSVPPLVVV